MLIVTKSHFCTLGEIWYDEDPNQIVGLDVISYRQWAHPIAGFQFDESYTMQVDLTESQDELWSRIGKNCRYKIKRAAAKDHVLYEYWEHPDAHVINEFSDFYDRFAAQKDLVKISRASLANRVNAGVIDLSHVKLKDGTSLVWHAHYRSNHGALLLYSASIKNKDNTAYQSVLGRANCYHHWQDILRFKTAGLWFYDFGGWDTGNNQTWLGINSFKEKFGGEIVKYFNYSQGITIKGKLYLYLRDMYLRLRKKLIIKISPKFYLSELSANH
jgi:hypothetical protein